MDNNCDNRIRDSLRRAKDSLDRILLREMGLMSPEQLLDYSLNNPDKNEQICRYLELKGQDYSERFTDLVLRRESSSGD
jgi:hypothetical protein